MFIQVKDELGEVNFQKVHVVALVSKDVITKSKTSYMTDVYVMGYSRPITINKSIKEVRDSLISDTIEDKAIKDLQDQLKDLKSRYNNLQHEFGILKKNTDIQASNATKVSKPKKQENEKTSN